MAQPDAGTRERLTVRGVPVDPNLRVLAVATSSTPSATAP